MILLHVKEKLQVFHNQISRRSKIELVRWKNERLEGRSLEWKGSRDLRHKRRLQRRLQSKGQMGKYMCCTLTTCMYNNKDMTSIINTLLVC